MPVSVRFPNPRRRRLPAPGPTAPARVEAVEPRTHFSIGFAPAAAYVAEIAPTTIAVADFNKDGVQDLAVATGGGGLQWLRGAGGGVFEPAVTIPSENIVGFVVAGDFNADGAPDLLATGTQSGIPGEPDVLIFVAGSGNGSFAAPVAVPLGSANGVIAASIGIGVGDLDRDSDLDAIVVNDAAATASVYRNNGAGAFTLAESEPIGLQQPSRPMLADVNNDAKLDVVVIGALGYATLLGNGDGTLQASVAAANGFGGEGVVYQGLPVGDVADVTGDGLPDIVGPSTPTETEPSAVAVHAGTGSATFGPAQRSGDRITHIHASLDLADVDGDAILDAIVADQANNLVRVFHGNGDGTFAAGVDFPTGVIPFAVTTADVNGDAWPDLLVPDYGGGTISVLLNTSTGTPLSPPPGPPGVGTPAALTATLEGELPASAIAGGKVKFKPTLVLANADGAEPAKGSVDVTLYASLDGIIDPSDAVLTSVSKKVNLKGGKTKAIKLPVSALPELPAGDYTLIAQVTGEVGTFAASSATSIAVAPPFVDLAVTAVNVDVAPTTVGGRLQATLTVASLGNTQVNAKSTLTLYASADDLFDPAVDNVISTAEPAFRLKPGTEKVYKFTAAFPDALGPGTYNLFGVLDGATLGDVDPLNGSAIGVEPVLIG